MKTEELKDLNIEYTILQLKTAARKANNANLPQWHHQFTRMGFCQKILWLGQFYKNGIIS
jgi:hypothetical protein